MKLLRVPEVYTCYLCSTNIFTFILPTKEKTNVAVCKYLLCHESGSPDRKRYRYDIRLCYRRILDRGREYVYAYNFMTRLVINQISLWNFFCPEDSEPVSHSLGSQAIDCLIAGNIFGKTLSYIFRNFLLH